MKKTVIEYHGWMFRGLLPLGHLERMEGSSWPNRDRKFKVVGSLAWCDVIRDREELKFSKNWNLTFTKTCHPMHGWKTGVKLNMIIIIPENIFIWNSSSKSLPCFYLSKQHSRTKLASKPHACPLIPALQNYLFQFSP